MSTRTFTFSVQATGLPSWVPTSAGVAAYTTGGVLTNSFASQTDSYYAQFYAPGIVNAYSGGVLNPHYGTYGAIVYDGAGHAASNNNALVQLELGSSTMSWRKVIAGSPIFGTSPATDNDKQLVNITANMSADWGEYVIDGKPAARHSYGASDIVGPSYGGATYGTFYRLAASALTNNGYGPPPTGTGAQINRMQTDLIPHKVEFGNLGATYSWARAGSLGALYSGSHSMYWSQFVPNLNTIFIKLAGQPALVRYSLSSQTYAIGSNALLDDWDYIDGHVLIHVPDRDLLIFADAKGGFARLRWASVANGVTDPSWNNTGVILPISVSAQWNHCCWCADSQRLLIGSSTNTSAVHEVAIPVTLTSTPADWVTTTHTLATPILFADNAAAYHYKAWSYNAATKSIVYSGRIPNGQTSDTVYVYRPRNT